MAGETDKVAGTIKEKVGAATGNERLESEGQAQHAEGKLHEVVEDVKEKAGDVVDAVKGAISGHKKD